MWEYTYNYSNELYHHGVKGMKWGVRKKRFKKAVSKTAKKTLKVTANKIKKHDAKVKKRADVWGIGGQVVDSTLGYKMRYNRRKFLATALNASANYYISTSNGSYYSKRGVDFVRKTGIGALSMSQNLDTINRYRDLYVAASHISDKKSKNRR